MTPLNNQNHPCYWELETWINLDLPQWATMGNMEWHRLTPVSSSVIFKTMQPTILSSSEKPEKTYSCSSEHWWGNWEDKTTTNKTTNKIPKNLPQWREMGDLKWCRATFIRSAKIPETTQSHPRGQQWGTVDDREPPQWSAVKHIKGHRATPLNGSGTHWIKQTLMKEQMWDSLEDTEPCQWVEVE